MPSANQTTSATSSRRIASPRNLNKYLLIGTGISFLTVLVLLPLAFMFRYASSSGLGVFWESISSPEALFSLRFTLLLAIATTLINGVMGTVVAFMLVRHDFPIKGGLISGSVFTFARSLGEFGATIMVSGNLALRTQTAPLFIFAEFNKGNIEAASSMSVVLVVLSFALFFGFKLVTRIMEKRGTRNAKRNIS